MRGAATHVGRPRPGPVNRFPDGTQPVRPSPGPPGQGSARRKPKKMPSSSCGPGSGQAQGEYSRGELRGGAHQGSSRRASIGRTPPVRRPPSQARPARASELTNAGSFTDTPRAGQQGRGGASSKRRVQDDPGASGPRSNRGHASDSAQSSIRQKRHRRAHAPPVAGSDPRGPGKNSAARYWPSLETRPSERKFGAAVATDPARRGRGSAPGNISRFPTVVQAPISIAGPAGRQGNQRPRRRALNAKYAGDRKASCRQMFL